MGCGGGCGRDGSAGARESLYTEGDADEGDGTDGEGGEDGGDGSDMGDGDGWGRVPGLRLEVVAAGGPAGEPAGGLREEVAPPPPSPAAVARGSNGR